MTSLARVIGTIRDAVALNVALRTVSKRASNIEQQKAYLVTAAVHPQFGCECDSSAEEEESIDGVHSDHKDRVDREVLVDGRGDEID